MKNLVFLILYILMVINVTAGTLEGTVYRKVTPTKQPAPERYLSRQNSEEKEDTAKNSSDQDMAIIYLTGSPSKTLNPSKVRPEIKQKNLTFDPWLLPVQIGTTVDFPNMDLVFHNVFSYSKTKKFDLGRYSAGKSKSVTFDKPGLVKVFCEIHNTMRAYILVLETPYFSITNPSGKYIIENIPEGDYTIHVWQENLDEFISKIHIPESGAVELDVR